MKRAELVYPAAGALGLLAALIGAVGAPRIDWSGDAAAVVNGVPIPREAAARAVLALQADSRNPVTPERERAALERLIEEELLVQRGVALGLAETDFAARRALVQSVLALAAAESAGAAPDEAELRRFYRHNAGFFAPAPRVAATVAFFRDGASAQRLAAARAALARGEPVRGDAMTIPVPASPLSQSEWSRLLGAEPAAALARLQPGEVSDPAPTSGGAYLIRANAFLAPPAPAFETIAEQVETEWRRRAGEAAVRAYIDRLKREARIERAAD